MYLRRVMVGMILSLHNSYAVILISKGDGISKQGHWEMLKSRVELS